MGSTRQPRREPSWQNEELRFHCIYLLLECRMAAPPNKTVPTLVAQYIVCIRTIQKVLIRILKFSKNILLNFRKLINSQQIQHSVQFTATISNVKHISVFCPGQLCHSPSFPSLHLRHSSFSNPSVALSSQLILQPFCCFTYVTAHSPTLLLLHLRHSTFTNPSFGSPKSQALHLHQLASHP